MSGLLFIIALFAFVGAVLSIAPKRYPNMIWPFVAFVFSVTTIELAWFWLSSQIGLTLIVALFGGLKGGLGKLSLIMLLFSWAVQAMHFQRALKTPDTLKAAMTKGLGHNYFNEIPEDRRSNLRTDVEFKDYRSPAQFDKTEIEVIKNVPYNEKPAIREMLDIYRPKSIPEEGCPVLLQIHGGAWVVGDKGHQGLPLMHHLAKRGWICVAINYRLSPTAGYPAHQIDCKSAISWIRREGNKYGMNPNFIAVTGGSAGGHLAALTALTPNDPVFQPNDDTDTTVQACIPMFGVFDMLSRFDQNPASGVFDEFLVQQIFHMERTEENMPAWDHYSPIKHVSENAPPFLMLHGTNDSIVAISESRVFNDTLSEVSKQPVVFAELEGADHGFEFLHSPRTEYVINTAHEFLEWCYAEHSDQHKGMHI